MPHEERFLTTEDAAEALKVSVFTMRRYLRAGKVRAVKLGKSWRVPERELRRLALVGTPESEMGDHVAENALPD